MDLTYVEKWRCGSCETLHDDQDAAQECCEPEISLVVVCTGCQKEFSRVKDAAACHPDGPAVRRCLCGTEVDEKDEDPSALLGTLIWCAECREQIVDGVPAPAACHRTFQKLQGVA